MIIDRALLRAVRADIDAALAVIGRKHDLLIKCGNGRFTDQTAVLKIDIAVAEFGADLSQPIASPKEVKYREAWPRFADSLNLPEEWLDCEFTGHDGERYTIVGISPSRPKYPVVTKRRNGRLVFHTQRSVLAAMAMQKTAIKKPAAKGARR